MFIKEKNIESKEKKNKVLIKTDFKGRYFVCKILEGKDKHGLEIFLEEEISNVGYRDLFAFNKDTVKIILKPNSKYIFEFRITEDWNYEHTECDVEPEVYNIEEIK